MLQKEKPEVGPDSPIPRKPSRTSVAPGVSLPSWEQASGTSIYDVTGLWETEEEGRDQWHE